MANAKEAPADPIQKSADAAAAAPRPKLRRRCAKCATPKPETHFKRDDGAFTPYCTSCRGRFPSLSAARLVLTTPRQTRKR